MFIEKEKSVGFALQYAGLRCRLEKFALLSVGFALQSVGLRFRLEKFVLQSVGFALHSVGLRCKLEKFAPRKGEVCWICSTVCWIAL